MSVVQFQDKTFLQYKKYWFVWESAWDSFRPIDGLVWNGKTFTIDDSSYCGNPLDELYGFGTEQMKQVCELLHEKYTSNPKHVTGLNIGNSEWFYDRFVTMTAHAPRDRQSWKRMVQGKHRTCRHAPRGKKLTRRNL